MKERTSITISKHLLKWAKDYLEKEDETFSGFIELKLIELSCSVNLATSGSK